MSEVLPYLGLQRGDEGKGRFVDEAALMPDVAVVARYNGANNAGHTLYANGQEFDVHALPSGILHAHLVNVIGNGVLVNPLDTLEEIEGFQDQGLDIDPRNLVISSIASIIAPHHIALDRAREKGEGGQGSTCKGVAFAAADRASRSAPLLESILTKDGRDELVDYVASGLAASNLALRAVRLGSKYAVPPQKAAKAWVERIRGLEPYIGDTVSLVHDALAQGNKVIAEGAQATSLDVNLGTYPMVSSSHPGVAGVIEGLGVSHKDIGPVTGVVKLIPSHVGKGHFPTEIHDKALSSRLAGKRGDVDGEFGTTTGRPRRMGYLDLPILRSAIRANGVDRLALTKLDLLPRFGDTMDIAVDYLTPDGYSETSPVGSERAIQDCEPVYETVKLWSGDIGDVRRFSDLPRAAQKLVNRIEDELQTEVRHLGVGYERSAVINRRDRSQRFAAVA